MPHSSCKFAVQDWVKCSKNCPIWKSFDGKRMVDHIEEGVQPEYWLKPNSSTDSTSLFPFTAKELEAI